MLPVFFVSQEIASCETKASGKMRSSQRRSLLARGTKAVLLKQWPAGCVKHTFVLSQEIASCETKSLRQDAQLVSSILFSTCRCWV